MDEHVKAQHIHKGLNLFRQLCEPNRLRDLDVFQCNCAEHDLDCECFWEQCEAWAKVDWVITELIDARRSLNRENPV